MTSTIDVTQPANGSKLDSSVIRSRLVEAKADIEALQGHESALQAQITTLIAKFKGVFTTLSALQIAFPTATAGDYAQIDAGAGSSVQIFYYDLQDGWVLSNTDGFTTLQNTLVVLQTALASKLDINTYIQHFKGVFPTLAALQTTVPTAIVGDYAQVDAGAGSVLQTYSFDLQDGWVAIGSDSSVAHNTDQLPEGISNLYFTNARAIDATLTSFQTIDNISDSDTVLSALQKLANTVQLLKSLFHITAAPVVQVPEQPNIAFNETAIVHIDMTVNFASNSALTYAATGLPSGLAIDAGTGIISGTLANDAHIPNKGVYVVTVSATDTNANVSYNSFVLTALKFGYDLLLHFDTFPFVDTTGKCTVQYSNTACVSARKLFGAFGFVSGYSDGIFVRPNIADVFTLDSDFTFKFAIADLPVTSTKILDLAGISLYANTNSLLCPSIENTWKTVPSTTNFLQCAIERYNGIFKLYCNGSCIATEANATVFSGILNLRQHTSSSLDEIMLLIGTAQASGADTYTVETAQF